LKSDGKNVDPNKEINRKDVNGIFFFKNIKVNFFKELLEKKIFRTKFKKKWK
jgi:hypothetical protein